MNSHFTVSLFDVALAVLVFNIPFGFWRHGTTRFTLPWFLALHVPVPLIVGLRILPNLAWRFTAFPVLIASFIAVQERVETGSIIALGPLFARCPHLPGVQVHCFPYHLARGVGGLFQNEETKRDRERLRKGRAAKAGGVAASVISMFHLGWLFPGSPPPASAIT